MDITEMILTIMIAGFGLNVSLMYLLWVTLNRRMDGLESALNKKIDGLENTLNKRIDGLENTLNKRIDGVEIRIDKLDEKITDIDLRLCRLEGAFSSKDCCMIKDDRQFKKVEGKK